MAQVVRNYSYLLQEIKWTKKTIRFFKWFAPFLFMLFFVTLAYQLEFGRCGIIAGITILSGLFMHGAFDLIRQHTIDLKKIRAGFGAESKVLEQLKKLLPEEYEIYNDCYIESAKCLKCEVRNIKFKIIDFLCNLLLTTHYSLLFKNETAQIDEIIIGPNGIFLIEIKNYFGTVTGKQKKHYWSILKHGHRIKNITNPIKQNEYHKKILKNRLKLDKIQCPDDFLVNVVICRFPHDPEAGVLIENLDKNIFIGEVEAAAEFIKNYKLQEIPAAEIIEKIKEII